MQPETWVILDTETTGRRPGAEPIEIAVVAPGGDLLFESTVHPHGEISRGAFHCHGLTAADLAGSPDFATLYPRLKACLAGKTIFAYGADFDRRVLATACRRSGVEEIPARWICVRELYRAACGYRPPLHIACEIEAIAVPERRHRAAVDAQLTWNLLLAMPPTPGHPLALDNDL